MPPVIDVLSHPAVNEFDDVVAVLVQKHFMHVSMYAHVFEPDEIVFGSRLIQPFWNARIEDAVIRPFGGDGENAHALEVHELVHRFVLQVAADFIAGTL
jgi:hypothetical protein